MHLVDTVSWLRLTACSYHRSLPPASTPVHCKPNWHCGSRLFRLARAAKSAPRFGLLWRPGPGNRPAKWSSDGEKRLLIGWRKSSIKTFNVYFRPCVLQTSLSYFFTRNPDWRYFTLNLKHVVYILCIKNAENRVGPPPILVAHSQLNSTATRIGGGPSRLKKIPALGRLWGTLPGKKCPLIFNI